MKGVALHCGRHGCVIRLEDGRFANLPASEAGYSLVRRSLAAQRRPEFEFIVSADDRWPRLTVAQSDAPEAPTANAAERPSGTHVEARPLNAPETMRPATAQTSLDEKIIEYLRQTADWDPTGAIASRAIEQKKVRAERMTLASELRARRRGGTAKRPNTKKH